MLFPLQGAVRTKVDAQSYRGSFTVGSSFNGGTHGVSAEADSTTYPFSATAGYSHVIISVSPNFNRSGYDEKVAIEFDEDGVTGTGNPADFHYHLPYCNSTGFWVVDSENPDVPGYFIIPVINAYFRVQAHQQFAPPKDIVITTSLTNFPYGGANSPEADRTATLLTTPGAAFVNLHDGTDAATFTTDPDSGFPGLQTYTVLSDTQPGAVFSIDAGTSDSGFPLTGSGTGIIDNADGHASMLLDVSGTWTGTLISQGKVRSTTSYRNIPAVDMSTGAILSSITANGLYLVSCAALHIVGVNYSIGSGTCNVYARSSIASYSFNLGLPQAAAYVHAKIAAASVTGSFATFLTPSGNAKLLQVFNSLNQTIQLGFGGVAVWELEPGDGPITLDYTTNQRYEANVLQIKHTGVAPTTGTIRATVIK